MGICKRFESCVIEILWVFCIVGSESSDNSDGFCIVVVSEELSCGGSECCINCGYKGLKGECCCSWKGFIVSVISCCVENCVVYEGMILEV